MRRVLRLAALVAACCALGVGFVVTAQAGNPSPGTPPGQEPCSHGLGGTTDTNGNAGPCKPDPQPARGKDCEAHGNGNVGGKNEDHCDGGGEDDGSWIG